MPVRAPREGDRSRPGAERKVRRPPHERRRASTASRTRSRHLPPGTTNNGTASCREKSETVAVGAAHGTDTDRATRSGAPRLARSPEPDAQGRFRRGCDLTRRPARTCLSFSTLLGSCRTLRRGGPPAPSISPIAPAARATVVTAQAQFDCGWRKRRALAFDRFSVEPARYVRDSDGSDLVSGKH